MSTTVPQLRQIRWWWLSPTRNSYRAVIPAGSIRRSSPAAVQAFRQSKTACRDTVGASSPTSATIVALSAWGRVDTASSTAVRGRVTRRPAARNWCS